MEIVFAEFSQILVVALCLEIALSDTIPSPISIECRMNFKVIRARLKVNEIIRFHKDQW